MEHGATRITGPRYKEADMAISMKRTGALAAPFVKVLIPGESGAAGATGATGVNGATGSIGATGATGVGLGLLAKNIGVTGGQFTFVGSPTNQAYFDWVFDAPFSSTDYSVDFQYTGSVVSGYWGDWSAFGSANMILSNKTTSGVRITIDAIFSASTISDLEGFIQAIAFGETGVPTQGPAGATGANGTNGATGATGADTSIVNNSTKTAAYTFALTDVNTLVIGASGAALTFTIPTNATTAFPTGSQILTARGGTGALGVTGAAGVTLNSAQSYKNLNNQYSGATLIKQDTDTWYMFGDLKA